MGTRTPCFWVEEAGEVEVSLRRYAVGPCPAMPGQYSYHNAHSPWSLERYEAGGVIPSYDALMPDKGHILWPSHCECGYAFLDGDNWQMFAERLYASGEQRWRQGALPPGAMLNCSWYQDIPGFCGEDGLAVVVVLPNNRWWHIDGFARNCTMPADREHKCWVRVGVPPKITVGKSGRTCAAGAGSIQCADFHGFLIDGELVGD